MNKLLTIAIPTYNRADLLDKQLEWLSQAIKGYESECEIFVSDNCSSDHTQEIIQKWQDILRIWA
jgi:glycosyltransferase involved in cell wall biosynthesis